MVLEGTVDMGYGTVTSGGEVRGKFGVHCCCHGHPLALPSSALLFLLRLLHHIAQLHAEGPGQVGAFIVADAALLVFGKGRVVLLQGTEVGGQEVGDELEIEGEVLGNLGGEHGDERQVEGDNFGVQRKVPKGMGEVTVMDETWLEAPADAEAQAGILVAPEVFAQFVSEADNEHGLL